ncbi:MAG TPA: AmmeMemoRadiSam system protein A [Candidatus Aveggerthella excrementigallinarum]|nr:AmmeMemoRadiSam system protein A [Candidatus Aveggerthella excrementigallinarum]
MAGALEEEAAMARGVAAAGMGVRDGAEAARGAAAGGTEPAVVLDAADAACACGAKDAADACSANEPCAVGVFGHELLSCEGPFGVGYAVAAFERAADAGENARGDVVEAGATEDDAARGVAAEDAAAPAVDPYVALARASVEGFVRTGRPIKVPADTPRELLESRAGVFVSLHEDGELRGCIGTIEPTRKSVAEEIVRNGVAACSEDPRFPPVREEELDYLELSVDVLFPAEPIASEDELDPVRYGVIVSKGWRRGLLLPNLEGVDTVEQQVAIAKRKAGIGLGERGVRLERFEVVRHERGGEARCVR